MVFEVLRAGKENAIRSEYLRDILKFKSVRELQKQIQGAKEFLQQLEEAKEGIKYEQSNERNLNSDQITGRP